MEGEGVVGSEGERGVESGGGGWEWWGVWGVIGGLYSAPLIPAGIRSFLRNPVDSGGMKFGRKACYFCHSGA